MKRVQKFDLDDMEEKATYESIINSPECTVYREEFSYCGKDSAIITVWWVENEEII